MSDSVSIGTSSWVVGFLDVFDDFEPAFVVAEEGPDVGTLVAIGALVFVLGSDLGPLVQLCSFAFRLSELPASFEAPSKIVGGT